MTARWLTGGGRRWQKIALKCPDLGCKGILKIGVDHKGVINIEEAFGWSRLFGKNSRQPWDDVIK
jgi:hypothetical protein